MIRQNRKKNRCSAKPGQKGFAPLTVSLFFGKEVLGSDFDARRDQNRYGCAGVRMQGEYFPDARKSREGSGANAPVSSLASGGRNQFIKIQHRKFCFIKDYGSS